MTIQERRQLISALALLAIIGSFLSSCGTIPNAVALLHTNPLYLVAPNFVGPEGPLTARQAQRVLDRLREHQGTRSDILQRHLAFEQALTNVPLAVGNKVTLLKDGTATIPGNAGSDTQRERDDKCRNVYVLRRTDRTNVCQRTNRAATTWGAGQPDV
jgi:hypothetical protein